MQVQIFLFQYKNNKGSESLVRSWCPHLTLECLASIPSPAPDSQLAELESSGDGPRDGVCVTCVGSLAWFLARHLGSELVDGMSLK